MRRSHNTIREDFDLEGDSWGQDNSSVIEAIGHVSQMGQNGATCVAWSNVDGALVVTIEINDDDTSEVQYRIFSDDVEAFRAVFPELIPER